MMREIRTFSLRPFQAEVDEELGNMQAGRMLATASTPTVSTPYEAVQQLSVACVTSLERM